VVNISEQVIMSVGSSFSSSSCSDNEETKKIMEEFSKAKLIRCVDNEEVKKIMKKLPDIESVRNNTRIAEENQVRDCIKDTYHKIMTTAKKGKHFTYFGAACADIKRRRFDQVKRHFADQGYEVISYRQYPNQASSASLQW
jgi:dihydroxyacetone kinase-like predicted kinase